MSFRYISVLSVAAVLVIGLLATMTGPALAQDTPVPDLGVTDGTANCTERIDANTRLCSADLDGETAVLTIKSTRPQAVTLTDAGRFIEGGKMAQRTVRLYDGENTVRMPVTIADGFVGVSIGTNDALYAVPLERSSTLIGPPWTAKDAQLAAAGAAVSVSLVALTLAIRSITGRSDRPERVA